MKKSKIFLILFLTCLCLFVFLGACDKEEHVHNYKSYVYKLATCKESGIMEKLCFECGDKKYEEIPKTNECDYEWRTIKEATCKEEGSKKGICKNCNEEITVIIAKKEHQFIWQTTQDATCFRNGKIKGTCADCSSTTNKVLPKIEHEYESGVCTMCFNKHIVDVLLQGEKLGYTLTDIEKLIQEFGYINSFTNIKDEIIKLSVKNEKVQFIYSLEGYKFAFSIDNIVSDYAVEGQEEKIVEGIVVKVIEDVPQLYVIYKDGSTIPVGYVFECIEVGEYLSINVVKSIAINKQNQLLAVLENNYIALLGTLSETDNNISPNILYMQTEDTYSCLGFLDRNCKQTQLIISPTHMGKVVDSIDKNAFVGNKYIEKIILSDEIKLIKRRAFAECSALKQIDLGKSVESIAAGVFYKCAIEEIIIPASCVEIGSYAFESCLNLTKIYYEGTKEQWREITFGRGWNLCVPATEVICSNGTVSIN